MATTLLSRISCLSKSSPASANFKRLATAGVVGVATVPYIFRTKFVAEEKGTKETIADISSDLAKSTATITSAEEPSAFLKWIVKTRLSIQSEIEHVDEWKAKAINKKTEISNTLDDYDKQFSSFVKSCTRAVLRTWFFIEDNAEGILGISAAFISTSLITRKRSFLTRFSVVGLSTAAMFTYCYPHTVTRYVYNNIQNPQEVEEGSDADSTNLRQKWSGFVSWAIEAAYGKRPSMFEPEKEAHMVRNSPFVSQPQQEETAETSKSS